MKRESTTRYLATLFLRAALVIAFVGGGWNVYRGLRGGETLNRANPGQTTLRIVLRDFTAGAAGANADLPVKLYPVDISAVRREYFSEHRAGVRFDDFLTQRMKGQGPITANLDEHGESTVVVAPGTWWVYATARGPQNEDVEWRLRVNVAGRLQTVELTRDNAYARMKRF